MHTGNLPNYALHVCFGVFLWVLRIILQNFALSVLASVAMVYLTYVQSNGLDYIITIVYTN